MSHCGNLQKSKLHILNNKEMQEKQNVKKIKILLDFQNLKFKIKKILIEIKPNQNYLILCSFSFLTKSMRNRFQKTLEFNGNYLT